MKLVMLLVVNVLAAVTAAVEAGVFYLMVDWWLGYDVSWVVVFAVAWCVQSATASHLRTSAKQEGLI